MLLRAVIFFVLFCGLSRGADYEDIAEFEQRLHLGVDNLFKDGIISEELKGTLGSIGLEHFFDYNYGEYIDPQLLCSVCEIVSEAVMASWRNGTSAEILGGYATDACSNLQIQPRHICEQLIKLNLGIFLDVIEKMPGLKGSRVCSIIFQDFGCKSDGGGSEWAIKIHEGPGRERTPGNGVPRKILHITDIHYDPLYKVGSLANCKHPICCQEDSGIVQRPEDAAGVWDTYYKCDTPKHTLIHSLNHMARVHEGVDYVYFTGDIMNHKVWATSIEDNTKSMITVLDAMSDAFEGIPVFPLFGNHEPHPLNVWIPANNEMSSQWLFDLVADLWNKWLPDYTKETIRKGGYYTVLVKPGFRIIAINSNVAYSYNWWLIYNEVDPFGQLAWMEDVLYKAELNGESVHILSHVPSGDDTCYIPWSRQFRKIIQRYSNTIEGIFNGHTHYDEFIVYHDVDNEPVSVAWNGGSFTPFTNNNPNYRIVYVDEANSEVLDYDEWVFNVTEANTTPEFEPNWFKLYSFKDAYGVNSMRPRDIHDLTLRIAGEEGKNLMKQFYRFRSREGPDSTKACNDACMKKIFCRLVTTVKYDTEKCDQLLELWL